MTQLIVQDLILIIFEIKGDVPGTYLYATGAEADNIRANFPNFIEEGIAFEAKI